jgi:hypothetical protein
VDTSESVTADAYGDRHLAFPLRDEQGRAIVVIDVSIGGELKALPKAETKEIMKMLKLLQQAYDEITKEDTGDPVLGITWMLFGIYTIILDNFLYFFQRVRRMMKRIAQKFSLIA